MIFDYRDCGFDESDVALCQYAIKLTIHPQAMNQADVDGLRNAGFSDDQITIAAQVIGYFNYINRIADGLGVDLEDWMDGEEEWKVKKPDWRADVR